MTQTPELVIFPVDESMDTQEIAKSAEEYLAKLSQEDNGDSPKTFLVYAGNEACNAVADTVELAIDNLHPDHKIESPELNTEQNLGRLSLEFCLDPVITDTPKFETSNARIILVAEPSVVRKAVGRPFGSENTMPLPSVLHIDSRNVADDEIPNVIPGTELLQKNPRINFPEVEFTATQKEKLVFKTSVPEKFYNEVEMSAFDSLYDESNTRLPKSIISSATTKERYAEKRAKLERNTGTFKTHKLGTYVIDQMEASVDKQMSNKDTLNLATVTILPVTQAMPRVEDATLVLEAV